MAYNLEEIKQQVKRVIEYSQELNNLNVDDLIKDWYINKQPFIKAFNDELIYEYPEKVSFDLCAQAKDQMYKNFISRIYDYWFKNDLGEFLETCVLSDEFFANEFSRYKQFNGMEFDEKMKIIKSFKYFVEDPDQLRQIQDEASAIIQQVKIQGRLCISVHPLDFLSSSETTYNWRSCHALDGEYRAGNLSYMADGSTVICYLKGDNDEKLPNFPKDVMWNSKKWRVLLFFSTTKSMVFAGRQYPFFIDDSLSTITDKLFANCNFKFSFSNWTNYYLTNIINGFGFQENYKSFGGYIPVEGELRTKEQLFDDGNQSKSLHYNDLLYSNYYKKPYYCYTTAEWGSLYNNNSSLSSASFQLSPVEFHIGNKVKCLRCNKKFIVDSSLVQCIDCELQYGSCEDDDKFSTCSNCGRRIYIGSNRDSNAVWVGDERVCIDCRNTYARQCACCGEWWWTNTMIHDEENDKLYCSQYCQEEDKNGSERN